MKTLRFCIALFCIALIAACSEQHWETTVTSPDGKNTITFHLSDNGTPTYVVQHKNKMVIDTSSMGFDFKEGEAMESGFKILKTTTESFDETWEMPWGEQRTVRNHFNGLLVEPPISWSSTKRPLKAFHWPFGRAPIENLTYISRRMMMVLPFVMNFLNKKRSTKWLLWMKTLSSN